MSPKQISMLERRFTCVRLSHSYLTRSLPRLLTMTFTTAVFGRSSSWRFGASSYKAAPKGPPSSLVQHDADRTSVFMTQCQLLPCRCNNLGEELELFNDLVGAGE